MELQTNHGHFRYKMAHQKYQKRTTVVILVRDFGIKITTFPEKRTQNPLKTVQRGGRESHREEGSKNKALSRFLNNHLKNMSNSLKNTPGGEK